MGNVTAFFIAAPSAHVLKQPLADLRFCFSLISELSDSDQQIITIYQCVHHSRHDECGKHIKYGMLFDEHGCHNNGDSQDQGTDADALFLLKAFAADNGKVCTQRIIYMNAGPQVGRSVCPIQSGYHTGEDIVSRHNSGTKVLSVGPQGGYDQENRHAREEEDTGAVIGNNPLCS